MITEWLLGLLGTLVRGLLSALPTFDPPSWFSDSGGLFASIFGVADSMGVWLPVTLGFTVLVAVLGCVVVGFAIKAVRIVASFATAGGGSAG